MIVYIVSSAERGLDEWYGIERGFTSREKAEQYVSKQKENYPRREKALEEYCKFSSESIPS